MAKQYEEFAKTIKEAMKALASAAEEYDKDQRFLGQTTGVIQEGVKEVGLRVQELKHRGNTGTDIKDFADDAEVKTMLASINGYMDGLKKELAHAAEVHKKTTPMVKLAYDTKTALAKEIKDRKKALSTKLGTGNKSLPDMEKLLADLEKYMGTSEFARVEAFVPEPYAQHEKDLARKLGETVKMAKEKRLSSEQKELDQQALNLRNLVKNVSIANKMRDEVLGLCAAVAKASQSGDQKGLVTAKAAIAAPLKELGRLAGIGERALKDDWILGGIKASKDKSKIEAGLHSIAQAKLVASKEVAKVVGLR